MELECNTGHVHPITRYHITEVTCTNVSGTGVWAPRFPSECSPVDCGLPPPGVHAHIPEVSNAFDKELWLRI